jgi:hypothetical protein
MPTPPQIAQQTNNGASLSNSGPDIGPEALPDSGQVAPGGRFPSQEELPVKPVSSIPATYGGFRPSDYNAPLPKQG